VPLEKLLTKNKRLEQSRSDKAGAAMDSSAYICRACSGFDVETKRSVQRISLLQTRAGPRDGLSWLERLREEYTALIQDVQANKDNDSG
jgi:hypothetical protein